jgi:hypothetical protein
MKAKANGESWAGTLILYLPAALAGVWSALPPGDS